MHEFKVGDMVKLNSGSPDLKVVELHGDRVAVEWPDRDGVLQGHVFPAACLTPVAQDGSEKGSPVEA